MHAPDKRIAIMTMFTRCLQDNDLTNRPLMAPSPTTVCHDGHWLNGVYDRSGERNTNVMSGS